MKLADYKFKCPYGVFTDKSWTEGLIFTSKYYEIYCHCKVANSNIPSNKMYELCLSNESEKCNLCKYYREGLDPLAES